MYKIMTSTMKRVTLPQMGARNGTFRVCGKTLRWRCAMSKAMKLLVAVVGLALCVISNAEASRSITYTVGEWQITVTDLGLLPGGTTSSALAINNRGRNCPDWRTTAHWALQRPVWDANTGAIIGMADNFDPASTAIPEHRNDNGEMAGTELINQNTVPRRLLEFRRPGIRVTADDRRRTRYTDLFTSRPTASTIWAR